MSQEFARAPSSDGCTFSALIGPQRIAVHANDVEHRLAVGGVAGERPEALGDARGLRVSFAAHQRGDGAGHVAAAVGIIGQRHGHQQRAQVGIAQAQRTELVRVVGDPRRRDSWRCPPGFPAR